MDKGGESVLSQLRENAGLQYVQKEFGVVYHGIPGPGRGGRLVYWSCGFKNGM